MIKEKRLITKLVSVTFLCLLSTTGFASTMYDHEHTHEGDSTSKKQDLTPQPAPVGQTSASVSKIAPIDQNKVARAIAEAIKRKGEAFAAKVSKSGLSSQTIVKRMPEDVQVKIVEAYETYDHTALQELIEPYLPKEFPGKTEKYDTGLLMDPVKDIVGQYLEPEDIKNATKAGLGFTKDHHDKALIQEYTVPARITPEDVADLKRAKTIIIDDDDVDYTIYARTDPVQLPNCQNVIIWLSESPVALPLSFLEVFTFSTNYTLTFQFKQSTPDEERVYYLRQLIPLIAVRRDFPIASKIILPEKHIKEVIEALRHSIEENHMLAKTYPSMAADKIKEVERLELIIKAIEAGRKK